MTGTPLADLRKKDRWEAQAEALISGESVAKAAQRCGLAGSTAFRWRHRLLAAAAFDKPARLSGIVEADETFILESFKGKRSDLPRAARKRGGTAAKRGLSAEQIPVLVARDRSGATTDAVLPKLNQTSITAALGGVVTSDNPLCCDGGKAIVGFARKANILARPCRRPVGRGRRLPTCTSTTSTAITAVSRNGCVPSMASRASISTITSAGGEPSKHGVTASSQPIGCSAQSASRNANKHRE